MIGLIILGKDPFTYFNTETPGIWLWAQENKVNEGQLCGQGSYGVLESLEKRKSMGKYLCFQSLPLLSFYHRKLRIYQKINVLYKKSKSNKSTESSGNVWKAV